MIFFLIHIFYTYAWQMQCHHFKSSSCECFLEKSSFIIFNMFLHFKFIYNFKNYEYDCPNSLPKCAFTFKTFGFMCLQHIWLRVFTWLLAYCLGFSVQTAHETKFGLMCLWDIWLHVFTWIFHQWLQQVALRCFIVAQKICSKEEIDGLHTEIVPTKRKKLIN